MQKTIILLIFSLCCCNTKKVIIENCNKSTVINVANLAIKKRGYKTDIMELNVTETDTSYNLFYSPNDLKYRGHEAEIIISKETCKIIGGSYYQ